MTQPGSAHRITVLLDTRVSLESLVLNRLRCLPETRRDEWLRGLLILGFRRECQAINHAQSNTAALGESLPSQTPFARWRTQGDTRRQPESPLEEARVAPPSIKPACSKPFAALKSVIG
jgi:hypothetical protein